MNIRRDLDDQPGIASTAENLGGVLSRLAAMRTIGAISRKQLNCFRRLPRSIGNGAKFRAGRTSPTTLARRSVSFAGSPTASQTLRLPSITSLLPKWPS
jgi:hypothetical protein